MTLVSHFTFVAILRPFAHGQPMGVSRCRNGMRFYFECLVSFILGTGDLPRLFNLQLECFSWSIAGFGVIRRGRRCLLGGVSWVGRHTLGFSGL